MKPQPSVLKIVDFAITKMDYQFIVPDTMGKSVNPVTYFKNYELDLDFDVFSREVFQIVMTVEINNIDKPLPGYKIKAEVTTLFRFENAEKLTIEEKRNIEGFSTVYMALNNLRGIISGFTSNAPFGRYTLPSVDLNDLIKKKREKLENLEAHKKETKLTSPKRKKVLKTKV